jgi:hypothetical protein
MATQSLHGPPHTHPEAQQHHREQPRRRGWADSLCSAASTGTLLAALVFFLLVVPQRTSTVAISFKGHGRKVAHVLSSMHERYTVSVPHSLAWVRGVSGLPNGRVRVRAQPTARNAVTRSTEGSNDIALDLFGTALDLLGQR